MIKNVEYEDWQILEIIPTLDLKDKKDIDILIRHLRHPEWDYRSDVAKALCDVPTEYSFQPLVECLQDDDELVVVEALESMAYQESENYFDSIVPCLKDKRGLVRAAACYALGCIGSEKAVPLLEKFIRDCPKDEALSAEVALHQLGQHNRLGKILAFLDSGNYYNRCGVANLIDFFINEENRDLVLQALKAALKKETERAPESTLKRAIADIENDN